MAFYQKPEGYGEYDPSPFVDDPVAFYEEMLSDENLKRAESFREKNPTFYELLMRKMDDARERLLQLKPKPFSTAFDPMLSNYCAFRIKTGGKWYIIDADHPYAELYPDIPEDICVKAKEAILSTVRTQPMVRAIDVDPAPFYESALREVFDEVEFIGTDFVPGRIY